jgi:hypothetical protein
MQGINLIPAHRLAARGRRLRIRGWCVGCGAYALLLAGLCIAARVTWGKDTRALGGEVEHLNRQVGELNASIKTERGKLAEVTSAIQTLKTVTEQPDWSILLTMLGVKIGDDTVLSSVRLEPANDTPGAKNTAAAARQPAADAIHPRHFNLELQGHARTQPAVSQLVQRLQDTRLFDDVKLLRSGRETFAGSDAFTFHLQCFLGEGGKGQP